MANQIPAVLRLAWGSWASLTAKVDTWAAARGYRTYSQSPDQYRFEGWGTVGFLPPKIACNVKFFPPSGGEIDAGRFIA
jgi:hypothetical protein